MPSSPLIIDAHCHAGPGDGFTGPWDTSAPLEAHAQRAERAGIAHTLIWPAFHTDYTQANAAVARIAAQNQARYSPVVFVHAGRERGRIAALVEHAVRTARVRGIKCHRYDARISREICDAARSLRLPIVYDPMGEGDSVELFAGEYPDVTFIIPHLCSFGDDWRAQRSFLDILARFPNVFTDTSGVRRFDLLIDAVRRAGPAKVLFGSDGPWLHPGVELAKVREMIAELRLSPAHASLLLSGNAIRLFRLHDVLPRLARRAPTMAAAHQPAPQSPSGPRSSHLAPGPQPFAGAAPGA
jgi:uncharacterized protein